MSLDPKKFRYTFPNLEFIAQEFRLKLFQRITKQAVPLFLRGQDLITPGPFVRGRHEDDVEETLKWAAREGYCDFLIDIGANVGLTSCLTGPAFSRIYCYEPNPLAFAILGVNLKIALPASIETHLFNCGIGDENATLNLLIPKTNWGGAYIADGNCYDMSTLSKKEGFSHHDPDNYLHETVEIRSAKTALGDVFTELKTAKAHCGVIKIDAEGYESTIMKAIAEILPADIKPLIVFENLLNDRKSAEVLSLFGGRQCQLFEIRTKRVRGAKILRLARSLFGASRAFYLEEVGSNLGRGNFVLLIS